MPYPAPTSILSAFQQELIGHWENKDFGKLDGQDVGGPENPLSYNIMPLPETSDPDGYILKNFKFSEKLKFNNDNANHTLAISAKAPNRGGLVSQNVRAVFYEQQVRFAEGPDSGEVVHVENGTWLWLPRYVQQPGAYTPGDDIDKEAVTDDLEQPSDTSIAKQIAVPHGNSILALGGFDTVSHRDGTGACRNSPRISGAPVIPDAPSPYPVPAIAVVNAAAPPSLNSDLNARVRYTTLKDQPADYQNPHPHLTQCPNRPLQQALEVIKPDSFMHWHVTTEQLQHGKGIVTNIPFERRVSEVTDYWADYWLLYKGRKKYLAYTQTILMRLTIPSKKSDPHNHDYVRYSFPHVTCNTVTHVA